MLESPCFVPALHNLAVHTALLSPCRWVRDWSSPNSGTIAQSAPHRLRVGHCSNNTASSGKAQMHPVLQHPYLLCWHWYFQQIGVEDCLCSAVPISQAVEQPRLLLQSKGGRSASQGKSSFAQMSLGSRDGGDKDGGLYQPQKIHRHSSAAGWTIIQFVPVKSLLQSPLSGLRLFFSRYKWPMVKTETFAKTNVWSEIPENSPECSYVQWCTRCRTGENKTIF